MGNYEMGCVVLALNLNMVGEAALEGFVVRLEDH